METKTYTEEQYETCYDIINNCYINDEITPNDDFDDIYFELLEYVDDYEDMDEEEQSSWNNAMLDAWKNYDEWDYEDMDEDEDEDF